MEKYEKSYRFKKKKKNPDYINEYAYGNNNFQNK